MKEMKKMKKNYIEKFASNKIRFFPIEARDRDKANMPFFLKSQLF